MKIRYRINTDLMARSAAQLVNDLASIPDNIRILTNQNYNAHSLIGILSAQIREGDNVVIYFQNNSITDAVLSVFNTIGEVISIDE